jgi:dsRNA-specific ribonuclease
MSVIDLAAKRQPVTYTLVITHHWDGHFEFTVLDVADDERSQEAVGYALKKAAEAWANDALQRLNKAAEDNGEEL